MFTVQPLSQLTAVWTVVALGIVMISAWTNRKSWHQHVCGISKRVDRKKRDVVWWIAIVGIVLANVVVVSTIYSSYWDATYYVGNVSYSLYYDSINTINPLYGTVMEYFDMKHCLATYHMNDAVFCQLFGIHPLVETKTIMVIVITLVLNMVYYRFAEFFFGDVAWKKAMMMGFCLLVNLCTYTAYTASSFVLLRTYEGKAIAGAIIASMLFYWFLQLFLKREEDRFAWMGLFVTSWGAAAISSSALFLVLVGIGCFMIVHWFQVRRWKVIVKSVICMMPSALVLACYLLNRLGLFAVRIGR